MIWYHKYIDDPSEAFIESGKYQKSLEAILMLPGSSDAAIYSKIDIGTGGMHYYFTPAASAVATAFNATQCVKPSRADIGGLLIGDQTLVGRLYP